MKNAQKPDHLSLGSLMTKLREGRFVIPDFQREFEWRPWDVRDLFKSIFLDYYIGTLLLWKGKEDNFSALSCEPIYGYTSNGDPEHIILDGQQRLTAIYYACMGPKKRFPARKSIFYFYLDINKFIAEEYDEAFSYGTRSSGWKKLLENREQQYEEHIFPLTIMGLDGWDLGSWASGYEDYWKNSLQEVRSNKSQEEIEKFERHAEGAMKFSKHLKELIQDYQISYIELDKDIGIDKVCDIFTQINSRGIRLDIFDLLNALLKPKGVQLKNMWREASRKLNFVDTEKMNVYVLQVMSILLQTYCSPKYLYFMIPGQPKQIRHEDGSFEKVVLVESNMDFTERWQQAVIAIEDTIKVLRNPRDYGAISPSFIPYPSIIPAFSAIRHYAKTSNLQNMADIQRKIRKWYWASVFTTRYSSAVESTSARDFIDLVKWFEAGEKKPGMISEFEESFDALDLKSETRKSSAIYKAIFNLLIIRGAKDWITFELPEYDALDDHHIVPASWGKNNDGVGGEIHSILNRTPLTQNTNRNIISGQLPNEYLRKMFEDHNEYDVYNILESHLISRRAVDILSRQEFGPQDYNEFLDERKRTIMSAIQDYLVDERIEVPLNLRDLGDDVGRIELRIRKCILDRLGSDSTEIPEHILVEVNRRINGALSKQPTLDSEYYSNMEGKLEYFDLREYQGLITNRSKWDVFSNLFGNKDNLIKRFDQLAELRNTISHNRTLDDVVRMDGEAAIRWFKNVFGMDG